MNIKISDDGVTVLRPIYYSAGELRIRELEQQNKALIALIGDIKAWGIENYAFDLPQELRQRIQSALGQGQ